MSDKGQADSSTALAGAVAVGVLVDTATGVAAGALGSGVLVAVGPGVGLAVFCATATFVAVPD
ncbi:hypothetical protein SDC9_141199 [bioreactor metagenome]|uniref:Uncharacterized protein n=1 Tax=bioreactor metagenome TaxID=1076179 RepID=A0A645DXJ1_9ZZZZ